MVPAMNSTTSQQAYPKYVVATIILAILLMVIPGILAFTVPSPSDGDGDAGAGPGVVTVVTFDAGVWS
jgi:hypothetical protein